LEWIERTFVVAVPAPQKEQIRKAALVELAGAELELLPGDVVVSRAGEKGVSVRIVREGEGALIAHQAGRPSIRFERVQ
jgi:hypothetical protein